MDILKVLQDRVEELTEKKCLFGFLNDFVTSSDILAEDKFILEPQRRESRTIGLNHRKERQRNVTLYYMRWGNQKTNSRELVTMIESFLEKLEKDSELLKYILNLDYQYFVSNEKRHEEHIIGTIVFEINIEIKER